jgi:hypothetical protein
LTARKPGVHLAFRSWVAVGVGLKSQGWLTVLPAIFIWNLFNLQPQWHWRWHVDFVFAKSIEQAAAFAARLCCLLLLPHAMYSETALA